MKNKVTADIAEEEKQQLYKNARSKDWYDSIWKNVGKCVFCDLKDKYILYEENGVVLTINLYPYIDGQLMAIPRRHVKSVNELTALEWETIRKFSYIAKKLFKKIHGRKAMWSLVKTGVLAQGTVADHLHMHFIPFDKQDLCLWNYRELQYTPLENAALYTKDLKTFVESAVKFEKKYKQLQSYPLVVDLILQNKKGKFLFQERKKEYKLSPDVLTLPGGNVDTDNIISGLEKELLEETGLKIDLSKITLLDSRFSKVVYSNHSKYLKTNVPKIHNFVWNTYKYEAIVDDKLLAPGDDCEKFVWLTLEEVLSHERVSNDLKDLFKKHF